ncbi:glycosyl hydrolase family 18 protein [Nitrosopumilus sp. b2]|uniref:glycosyl hydrolase family 18 protein n=1 Tax=Nitrosopumilus sp. b2 TaxID=2109908 RepID=UPI0015F477D5|nr:glycosyl hydrolase family 18 protein [Nitrosopumilus sp. b2]KAF6244928.1 hypothetical protein C6989_05985 [Nitrosopumilus sp. b2]
MMNYNLKNRNTVLYGSGLFDDPSNPTAEDIAESGFTTVILWTLHIHSDGTFYYNNTKAVDDQGKVTDSILKMKNDVDQIREGQVSNVLFCIGSADVGDFKNISALLGTTEGTEKLRSNFTALSDALEIDGFDFDLEEFPLDNFKDTIATLTLMLSNIGKKSIITYCPYTDQTFWNNCLTDAYHNNNQLVSWLNVQCYSGGSGNSPSQWAEQIPKNIGIDNPAAFVVPGYNANDGSKYIQSIFERLSKSDAGIDGGFIWNSSEISTSGEKPAALAQAIIKGLDNVN